ncbi:MAG: AAA family ATPase [Actinobacteria bacterium]|nr:AAA family ATPase [Actinomycetota bacterium]
MTRLTRADIEQKLLRGEAVFWGEGSKGESIQLRTPASRQLLQFLLKTNTRVVKGLPQIFVDDLAKAFTGSNDPATQFAGPNNQGSTCGPWKLACIESEGFGGINTWGGVPFKYELDGDSLVLDGPNGSGKSSLIAAITWAVRGERVRDSSSTDESHTISDVFDARGSKVGEWPPLACYPKTRSQLATSPAVFVKLTFKDPTGRAAALQRNLRNGVVSLSVDPALQFPTVLVECGLMMPARLSHLRFGAGDQHLSDAIQMLTGLDEIASLGDFVGDLCHKSRDYLNYSKSQRRDEIHLQFLDDLEKARKAVSSIGMVVPSFTPADATPTVGNFATLEKTLSEKATEAVAVIGSDLLPGLDLKSSAVQTQVALAIDAATNDFAEGLASSSTWKAMSLIAIELKGDPLSRAIAGVATAKKDLIQASEYYEYARKDSKFQLKALGASWHAVHGAGPIDSCPLCEQDLRENSELTAELEAFKSAGELATKAFNDNVNAIRNALNVAMPQVLRRYLVEDVKDMTRAACILDWENRFYNAQRYSQFLVGVAKLFKDSLENCPEKIVPPCELMDRKKYPSDAEKLLNELDSCSALFAIGQWMEEQTPQWSTWWNTTTGNGVPPSEIMKKLQALEESVRAWTPYADAAKSIASAMQRGRQVDLIDKEQSSRQSVADSLDALKTLRRLAEAETRSAIEGLSTRMEKFLDEIYVSEKLKFKSAHFEKKTGVRVRGGFDAEIRIDATLVANTSWIRALLWAFILAVREEAVEHLGADTFPLIVLDDPQATFDVNHRHRWIQRMVAMQKSDPGLQILITAHDEPFLNQLNHLAFQGRRAHIAAAAQDLGHIFITDGTLVDRAWEHADSTKTPAAGLVFISESRKFVEAMLKVMLRGEADTNALTTGKLRERVKQLHFAQVSPWNRLIFKQLVGILESGNPAIGYLESSHHTTGSMLGMSEAQDVRKFLSKELLPHLERAFRHIREYRLLHGESKALFADAPIVSFPEGRRDVVRSIPLQLVGRASALTAGRLADGDLEMTAFESLNFEKLALGNHDAYRIATPTLEPVARPGDVLLVAVKGPVVPGSLVVAASADKLLARRFLLSEEHPDIAVLVAQAITPSAIAPPLIAHISTLVLRAVTGVLFDPAHFSAGAAISGQEIMDCGSDSAITSLLKQVIGVVAVSGSSAEPQVLNGQYLLVGREVELANACNVLDGRPVIASDSDGHNYFKRLRCIASNRVILESLHSGGEYSPVELSLSGDGKTILTKILPVVGVLFERS